MLINFGQIIFIILPITFFVLIFSFFLFLSNFFERQKKIFLTEIKFPLPHENKNYDETMFSFFSAIHDISKNERISIEVYKYKNNLSLIVSTLSKESQKYVVSYLTKIDGIFIRKISKLEDPLLFFKKDFSIDKIYLTKDFYTINFSNTGFFNTLINSISSLSDDDNLGIFFILRGTNKDFSIQKRLDKRIKYLSDKKINSVNDELIQNLKEKKSSSLFLTDIYLISNNKNLYKNIISIFKSLNYINKFKLKRESEKKIRDLFLRFSPKENLFIYFLRPLFGSFLNAKELSLMIKPENIDRSLYKNSETKVIEADKSFFERGENILIGKSHLATGQITNIYFPLKNLDRHVYLSGKTGMGKSTVLIKFFSTLSKSKDKSLIFFDPHGSDLEKIIKESKSLKDFIYFDLSQESNTKTITYNPFFCFKKSDGEKDARIEQYLNILFEEAELKGQIIGTSTEGLLRKGIETLIYFADAYFNYLLKRGIDKEDAEKIIFERQLTFNDLEFLFDKNYRYRELMQEVFSHTDSDISRFWLKGIESYNTSQMIIEGVRNRLNNILFPSIKLIYEGNKFNIVNLIKEKKKLLIPLTTQSFGEISRSIFAKMILSEIWFNAQYSNENDEVIIFIDEFQNVQMKLIDSLLSEARKYKIRLIFGNQYFGQLEKKIQDSIKGNVSTLFAFNTGNIDEAKNIPPLFKNKISTEDISNLPLFTAYLKTINEDNNTALMSYETLNEKENIYHQNEDIDKLSFDTLQIYGEEKAELRKKILEKQNDAIKYFLEDFLS